MEARETCKGDRSGFPTVGLEHITPGEIRLSEYDVGSDNTFTKRFHEGDILFGRRRAYLKKAAIAPFEGICSGDITVIRAIQDKMEPRLLPFVIQNDDFFDFAVGRSAGSLSPRVKWEHLKTYSFELPEMDKQRELADVLWAIEDTRAAYQELAVAMEELVKSQFVELFGDLRTNSKKWMTRPLGELCSIYRGGSPRPITQFLGGDVPWIKIRDATKGDSIYLHGTSEHIKREGVSKSRMVKNGSLIFANCGVSLGFARITTFDGCIHDGWLSLEDVAPSLDKVFLLLSLNQMTEDFRMRAPTGTQPNLNTAIMKAHQQILPPLLLQQQYVSFIQQIDKSKLVLRQLLEKQQTLKAALMQEYFAVH